MSGDAGEGLQTLRATFDQQKSASLAAPEVPWAQRADRLRRLERLVEANAADFAAAISRDFGHRSAHETDLLEVFPSLGAIRHALAHGRRWMRGERRATGMWFLPARASVVPQPLGVAGIIVPWNYPLYLAIGPLAAALAAGNRAMLKLSEFTPAFGALFADLCTASFAADELAVVTGDVGVAAAFSRLPFDHLLFTGSTSVGREVMRAAAGNLTPVTLELGGKSPAIVAPGYSMRHAASRILLGKCLNAGQTCIAPDYVLVPAGSEEAFVAAARAAVARMYPRIMSTPDYSSIVSARHYARLSGYLDEARAQGATVENLAAHGEAADPVTRRMPPVALTGVADGLRVMQEEIFGPLLPVVGYADIDAAIAYVNARPRPLALYLFDHDTARIGRVLARTTAGGVTINDTLLHVAQESLPFGGVGASGMGHYHGYEGFAAFSKMKPVLRQSRFNGVALFNPPYGPRTAKMIALLKRWA
ncbi:MAG: coniferyl aldehyde dehydrogenase [Betaproteobacteria bacterium]